MSVVAEWFNCKDCPCRNFITGVSRCRDGIWCNLPGGPDNIYRKWSPEEREWYPVSSDCPLEYVKLKDGTELKPKKVKVKVPTWLAD
jgi:hypothetical protein